MFDNEHITFANIADAKLKTFIEENGGIVSFSEENLDVDITTLIVYPDKSNFRKGFVYKIAKQHDIPYLSKSKFLEEFDLILDGDSYVCCNNDLIEDEDIYADIKNIISTELNISDGKKMCELLKKNFINFFDEIYIPFKLFKENNWNIVDTLYSNMDTLFYNEEYLTNQNKEYFFKIFDKYIRFIGQIWITTSQFKMCLKKWEGQENPTYLKKIMTDEKYEIISPLFLSDMYKKTFTKYQDNTDIFNIKFKKKLDKIINKYEIERDNFDLEFNKIVNLYVYNYPINYDDNPNINPNYNIDYAKELINTVTVSILAFADKLIDLNIYTIHAIIYDVINYYIMLDDINSYDPDDYNKREILII